MTEIGFYHLLRTAATKTRCRRLLARTLAVAASGRWSQAGSEELDKASSTTRLWRWGPSSRSDSFLPHGT